MEKNIYSFTFERKYLQQNLKALALTHLMHHHCDSDVAQKNVSQ